MRHCARVVPRRPSTHAQTSINHPGRGSQIGGVATLLRHRVMSYPTEARHTATILVVDDESWVRHLIQRMLTCCGYSVLEAPNAEHAMVVAERHACEIHLLVTDVMLPDMNGFDLAYCLGGIMKVLFVTGHANHDDGVRAGLRGTSFLCKPFRADQLQRSVRRVLDVGPLAA